MNLYQEIAAGNLTVNYDMLKDDPMNRYPKARVIKGVALVGSAAAGDMGVEIVVGGVKQGRFMNSNTGLAVKNSEDLKVTDIFVPPNAQIQAIIFDAGGTNSAGITVMCGAPARTSYRRSSYRRTNRNTSNRRSTGNSGMY